MRAEKHLQRAYACLLMTVSLTGTATCLRAEVPVPAMSGMTDASRVEREGVAERRGSSPSLVRRGLGALFHPFLLLSGRARPPAPQRPARYRESLLEAADAIERDEVARREKRAQPWRFPLWPLFSPSPPIVQAKTAVAGASTAPVRGRKRAAPVDEKSDEALRQVRAREGAGDDRDAESLRALDRLIGSNPEYAEAYLERAKIYLRQKLYERAVEDYRKVLSCGGDEVEGHYGLGTVYGKWGEQLSSVKRADMASEKYRDAIAAYKEVLWRCPGYAPACYSLGCTYARLGQREDAAFYFQKTVEHAGRDSDLSRRARYNISLMGGY